jgi:uncharacterized membrane protein
MRRKEGMNVEKEVIKRLDDLTETLQRSGMNDYIAYLSSTKRVLWVNLAAGLVTSVFASMFGIGLASVFLSFQYNQPAAVRNLFLPFLDNADRSVRVRFFVTLGEYFSLLPIQVMFFFIPRDKLSAHVPLLLAIGLICCIGFVYWVTTYAMVNYLLLDFPDLEAWRVLVMSRKMMDGNRLRLIRLILRLLPMHLLGIFSFGLANIWAGCCQHACTAAFYKDMIQVSVK